MPPRTVKSPQRPAVWKQIAFGALFFLVLSFIVYSPSLRGEFLWDDDVLIYQNELIHADDGLKDIWFSTKSTDYFPLTLSVFWLEWRLWRLDTVGYHVVNVLLHAVGAMLLWRLLLRLRVPGAFAAAAIFAVHPMCVSSVAWIAELKNTLSLVFFLLSALLYVRSDATGTGEVRQSLRDYWLSLVCFLLALLSKTSVVMLPVALLGIAWWRRGTISRQDILRTTPFFVLSLALGLATIWFQKHRAIGAESDPLLMRLAGGGWATWFYLWKAVAPVQLTMVYPRWVINPASIIAWVPWVLWAGALASLWFFRARVGRGALVAIGYFFITLLPVLGIFDMAFFAYSRVADHFQYLSLIGIVVLATAALASKTSKGSRNNSLFVPVTSVVVIIFSVLSWNYAGLFASPEKLWRQTMKQNPKAWVAYSNLGIVLAGRDEKPEAIELFRTALDLNPRYADAWNNLGSAYSDTGRFDEAIECFQKAMKERPDYATAENNWGLALIRSGKFDEARAHFIKALELSPNFPGAHYNLALTYAREENFEKAIEHYQAAVRGNPEYVAAHLNLAMALSDVDRLDDAAVHFNHALRLDPNLGEAYNGLGIVMIKKKDMDGAIRCFTDAARVDPRNVLAQMNLGQAFSRKGNAADALRHFNEAIKLAPDNPSAYFQCGAMLAKLGRRDEATMAFQEAIRLRPNYREAQEQLTLIQSQ